MKEKQREERDWSIVFNCCRVVGGYTSLIECGDVTSIKACVEDVLKQSPVEQCFSNLSWRPSTTLHFGCLLHVTHLVQIIS